MKDVKKIVSQLVSLTEKILVDEALLNTISLIANKMIQAYKSGNKILFCGNGGSAAEAQHLAAELSGKFYLDRPAIPAEACHVNSSFMSAVSNDYDFTTTYSRYIQGFGKTGDILIGLSTSGNSENITEAFQTAKKNNILTVALTGASGGELKEFADFLIKIPSVDVPRIQEAHLLVGHILCEIVEDGLFA